MSIRKGETIETNNIQQPSRIGTLTTEKIVFTFLSLFLLLPSLLGVVMAQDLLTFGQRCIYLITALLLYAFGLCVMRRRTFFYVASLTFVFSGIEVVHLIMNHATTSLLFVFTVIKSEPREIKELCSTYWFVALIFFALWGVYFYLNHRFIQREYIAPRKWRMIALGIIVLFFAGDLVALKLRPKMRNIFSVRQIDLRTAAWVGSEKVCPINMVLAGYHLASMAYDIHEQNKALENFTFGIPRLTGSDSTLVVFLIGETSRYDHWSVNGYERPTSPCLAARGTQVISFDSCYSIANLTTVSVPFMLSRATPQTPQLYPKEKSLVDAFQEAGYKTAWIADQSFNNHFLHRISAQCDYTRYIPPTEAEVFVDTVLLAPLRYVLQQDNQRQMIVLHSLGCHFKYSERYPDDFQVFTPDMKGMSLRDMLTNVDINDDGGVSWRNLRPENLAAFRNMKAMLINSYDNAIHFADYFIDRVLCELEQTGRSVVLVYVGDHGENLLDDERNMFMHGTFSGSYYEYHVPLFVWTSEAYRRQHPDRVAAIQANRTKQLSTMYLFHSLLDLGGVPYSRIDSTLCIDRPAMQAEPVIYGLDANMHAYPIPTRPN